jgi:HEAT repeats
LHTFLKGSYSFVTVIQNREPHELGSGRSALPASESSTLSLEPSWKKLDWSSCLAGFADEDIEDGMTATLGERISILIRFRGSKAIEELKVLISSNSISPSLASHTLRWLGRIKEAASFDLRLALLCENLRSKSPVVRDGASLGLAALGSPKAIPDLQNAIKHEKLPGLRADMEQVLRELQF